MVTPVCRSLSPLFQMLESTQQAQQKLTRIAESLINGETAEVEQCVQQMVGTALNNMEKIKQYQNLITEDLDDEGKKRQLQGKIDEINAIFQESQQWIIQAQNVQNQYEERRNERLENNINLVERIFQSQQKILERQSTIITKIIKELSKKGEKLCKAVQSFANGQTWPECCESAEQAHQFFDDMLAIAHRYEFSADSLFARSELKTLSKTLWSIGKQFQNENYIEWAVQFFSLSCNIDKTLVIYCDLKIPLDDYRERLQLLIDKYNVLYSLGYVHDILSFLRDITTNKIELIGVCIRLDKIEGDFITFHKEWQQCVIMVLQWYMNLNEDIPLPSSITLTHCVVLDDNNIQSFLHENLTHLNLQGSSVTDVMIEMVSQRCPKLQVLYLNGCDQLKNVKGTFEQLEILHVIGCEKLTQVSIKASHLHTLKANNNKKLSAINETILACKEALQVLNLSNCDSLQAIEDVQETENEMILQLPQLRILWIRTCRQLQRVKIHVPKLHILSIDSKNCLKEFYLSGCEHLQAIEDRTEINALIVLSQLRNLRIINCTSLQRIYLITKSLRQLIVKNSAIDEMSLDVIIASSKNCLQELHLSECENLKAIEAKTTEDSAVKDSGTYTEGFLNFQKESQGRVLTFPQLKILCVNACIQLQIISISAPNLRILEANSNFLTRLILVNCGYLKAIDNRAQGNTSTINFPQLEELHMWECIRLQRVNIITPKLRSFSVGKTPQNNVIASTILSNKRTLEKLYLYDCPTLQTIEGGTEPINCSQLKTLCIWDCPCLKKVNITTNKLYSFEARRTSLEDTVVSLILSNKNILKKLCLDRCSGLKVIGEETEPINFPQLENLEIESYDNLQNINITASLRQLKYGRFNIIGKSKWMKFFETVEDPPPLPNNILQILNSSCPFWPDRKVKDTHNLVFRPMQVNNRDLTLKYFVESMMPLFSSVLGSRPFDNVDDRSPIASYWMLMTTDSIPGIDSRDQLIRNYPSYDIPYALEYTMKIFDISSNSWVINKLLPILVKISNYLYHKEAGLCFMENPSSFVSTPMCAVRRFLPIDNV